MKFPTKITNPNTTKDTLFPKVFQGIGEIVYCGCVALNTGVKRGNFLYIRIEEVKRSYRYTYDNNPVEKMKKRGNAL